MTGPLNVLIFHKLKLIEIVHFKTILKFLQINAMLSQPIVWNMKWKKLVFTEKNYLAGILKIFIFFFSWLSVKLPF